MREKKLLLHKIHRELDLDVVGIDNFKAGIPSLLVANHTCLKDIFVVPAVLPEACQNVLSARLMWKRNNPENSMRRIMIENSLYGIPLEVHGGRERSHIGLEMAKRALIGGWSVLIFPEGAYTEDIQVNKGRTGAAHILFGARQAGVNVNLIPVGIDNRSKTNDLDDFVPRGDSMVINIGKPIDYEDHYNVYIKASSREEINKALHAPVDIAMRSIANSIEQPYVDEYIELRKRDTIILESGEEVPLHQSDYGRMTG